MWTVNITLRLVVIILLINVIKGSAISSSVYTMGQSGGFIKYFPPKIPTQFNADIIIMSHLTDPRQEYPPSVRKLKVQYDYVQKLAKIEIKEGYEAGKTYVRRYDEKKEYMVKHGRYQKCERAYLGEEMPVPSIGYPQFFKGIVNVRGRVCEHWSHDHKGDRFHIYVDKSRNVPIRLTQETLINSIPTMVLTYDLDNIQLGPQDIQDFVIPEGYSHSNCTRNVGGFPYIHVFHYYLRF